MQTLKRGLKRRVINFSKQRVLKQFLTVHTAAPADLLRQTVSTLRFSHIRWGRVFQGAPQQSGPSFQPFGCLLSAQCRGSVPDVGETGLRQSRARGLGGDTSHGVSLALTGQHALRELPAVWGNAFLPAAVLQRACSRNRKSQGSHILKHPERTGGGITATDTHLLKARHKKDALG